MPVEVRGENTEPKKLKLTNLTNKDANIGRNRLRSILISIRYPL